MINEGDKTRKQSTIENRKTQKVATKETRELITM